MSEDLDGDGIPPHPWRRPPHDELPVAVPVQRFMVRDTGHVLAVREALVYSEGVAIRMAWAVRDDPHTELPWFVPVRCLEDAHQRQRETAAAAPRFAARVGEGPLTPWTEPLLGSRRDPFAEPAGPSLVDLSGSSTASDRVWYGSSLLWFWAPGHVPSALACTWRTVHVETVELPLDASKLQSARPRVTSYWAPAGTTGDD